MTCVNLIDYMICFYNKHFSYFSNLHQCGTTTQYSIGNVNVHVTGEAVLYIISKCIFTIKYDNDNLLIMCYQAKGTLYALTCLLENIFHSVKK